MCVFYVITPPIECREPCVWKLLFCNTQSQSKTVLLHELKKGKLFLYVNYQFMKTVYKLSLL